MDELGKVFEVLGELVPDQQLRRLVAEADDDENGEIDFCEFVQMMVKHKQKEDMDHELEEAFKVFLQSRRAADAFFGLLEGDWCGLSFHTLYGVGHVAPRSDRDELD